MEDSVTYQAVIEKGRLEGRLEEARTTLLRQGTAKFQAPSETTRQRIESITDLEQLEQWLVRVLFASSWDDLMAEKDPVSGNT